MRRTRGEASRLHRVGPVVVAIRQRFARLWGRARVNERACEHCQTQFMVNEWSRRVGKRFCSERCRNIVARRRWQKGWKKRNPDKIRAQKRAWKKRTYERARNTGICEVCGCFQEALHHDHDHKTNKWRGWLCRGCNLAIGLVKDNPTILRDLANYLERNA